MARARRQDLVVKLRDRRAADDPVIARLNDLAFGGPSEAKLIAELRLANLAVIELVACDDDTIIGHILFSALSVAANGQSVATLALAPMAVLPARQRQGVGSTLVHAGLKAARGTGWQAVIVLGHADYYPRFGFSAARARHLKAPFAGGSFMALDLAPGALDGDRVTVVYPAPFGLA